MSPMEPAAEGVGKVLLNHSMESQNMLSCKGLISFWDLVFKNGVGLGVMVLSFTPEYMVASWG